MDEYPIEHIEKPPHGNTKTGLPFHKLEVGESFRVPPSDYPRVNCARAHYQKRMRREGKKVKFSSRSVRAPDRTVIEYVFTRDQ